MIQATQLKRGGCASSTGSSAGSSTEGGRGPAQDPGQPARHGAGEDPQLKSGAIIDHRFRSVDMVERAILDETEMEYLYQDGDMYHFMNNETFEQIGLSDEVLGDAVHYLIPNIKLKMEMYEGRPVGHRPSAHSRDEGAGDRSPPSRAPPSRTWASPPRWRPG